MSLPPTRRIVLTVAAVIVAAVCVRLGFWQLDRLQERRALNAAIGAGLAAPTTSFAEALDAPQGDLAYRRVTADGTFDVSNELLLYGRALEGSPGDHVLTPLVLDEGQVVLVDRGWVPFVPDRQTPVEPPAEAPTGHVTVEGVLLPPEEGGAFADDGEGGIVRAVRIDEIDARMTDHDLAPVYLLLEAQSPPQPEGLPVPATMPAPTEGPHLSYAIQWFTFATIAVVGYVVLMRKDRGETRTQTQAGEG